MSNRTFSFALAALLLPILGCGRLVAQDDYEPKPIPAGPDAYTQPRHDADKARFWREVLLAQCKDSDAVRKEWQPHVEELMTRYGEFVAISVPNEDRTGPVLGPGERLLELGCKDPVVQLVMADMRRRQGKQDAARELYATCAKELGERRLAASVEYLRQAGMAAAHFAANDMDAYRKALALRDDALVELAAAPEFGGGNERFHLELVLKIWKDTVGPSELPLLERMEKRAARPNYALLVLRAMYHNKQAWAARGESAASAVGEDDWKVFNKHMRAAADAATRASQLCPKHPEAPTMMLKTIGPAGAEPKELRRWLDLAVAAQFDWTDAYMSYLHFLQPRWGGSQRALEKFGAECLETARFDTLVPELYRNAIQYVTLDARKPTAVWARESVQRRLEELDAGYLAAARDDAAARWTKTRRVAALAIADRAKEAAALCEQIGHRLDPRALEIFDVSEQWVMKAVRPHFTQYEPAKVAPSDALAGFETATYLGVAKARAMTAHERAITDEEFDAAFAKWVSATFLQAYERAGTKDAAWDEDARALFADMGPLAIRKQPPLSRERAERVLKAGCKDPLALYVVTRFLDPKDPRAVKTLVGAMDQLAERQPPLFSLWAEQHLADLANAAGRPGVGSGLLPQIREHMVAAVTDAAFAGENRRYYVRCVWGKDEFAKEGNHWVTDKMIASLGSMKDVDPWLLHVVTGLHWARKAKHPTGSPNERRAHIKLANEHLVAAHALCPQFPEAAVGMIVISSIEQVGDSPREWFDRALDAQIDYEPAYCAYVDSITPLYYGSVKAMYRFAVECLDSGRFDTKVPLWYALTMQRIQAEVAAPRTLWAAAGVAERLDKMFRGYEAQRRKVFDAGYLLTARCVLAWAGGRYDDALGAWAAAGKKLDARFLDKFGGDPDLIEFDLQFLGARRSK